MRDRYGSPDVLELKDVDLPVVGDGDVLVRVHAASLNAADLDYLFGRPFLTRMGTGLRTPKDQISGRTIVLPAHGLLAGMAYGVPLSTSIRRIFPSRVVVF